MAIKSFFQAVSVSLFLASGVLLPSALAQTIASKVENVGTPRHVEITGLQTRETNGLLTLSVEFSNSDYDDQQGYYRVQWMDEAGFPVWEEEAWKPILLHGAQKSLVRVIAPTIKAKDFKIIFSADRNWAANMGLAPVQSPSQ